MAKRTNAQKAKIVKENCQRQPTTPSEGIVDCKQQGCISEAGEWAYSNESNAKLNCRQDCKSLKKTCELTEKQKKKFATEDKKQQKKLEKRNAAFARRKKKGLPLPKKKDGSEQTKKNKQNKNYNWKNQHCQDIMIMPNAEGIRDNYNQLRDELMCYWKESLLSLNLIATMWVILPILPPRKAGYI
ncbi:hypothetical protein [sulfur-oxidizing endosymbiont of Gigantopelta aegis]|uniref:hypothetical protein n=1 Tax=sulfur-oxidizing endosymbiont of Gigantopelta aegis TaxID=2794934 RepID=UPI0018DD77AD|nr:hypothetical protein [sulfur-oxidizing endosymbiont of Gigantopelta aegis]